MDTTTVASAMTEAVTSLMSVVTSTMTFIEGNSWLVLFLTVPIVGAAIGIIRRLVGNY